MFKIKNYFSLIIFAFVLALVFAFNSFKTISTNLEAVVSNSEKKELLKKFNEFKISKKLFLYVDNLDDKSLNKIKDIENKLLEISTLTLEKQKDNEALNEYKKEYFLYQNSLNLEKLINLSNLNIEKELENLKSNLLNSQFGYFVNSNDPFSIFKKEQEESNFFIKNNHLAVKDKGYFSIFSISSSVNSIDDYENLYNEISNITKDDKDIKIFSSIFYFVENSKIIKDDVNKIIYLATFILVLLYLIILRDLKLLFNALLTLGSSILFALLVCSFIFPEISIFVVVFGISISTVAIDYMFHHYVHKEYEGAFKFNKDVFLGMLTTITAFFILSFISFNLIKQLSIFTFFTLLFSYIQFAFIYQKIGFKYKENNFFNIKTINNISAKYILVFTLIALLLAIYNFKFDSNLKNLDVKNKKLNSLQEFFNKDIANNDKVPFLIKAKTIDELIQNSKTLKEKFPSSVAPLSTLISKDEFLKKQELLKNQKISEINSKLEDKAKEFGFKDGYFKEAYKISQKEPNYTLEYLQKLDFEILKFENSFISYVNVSKDDISLLNNFDFVINLSLKSMFEDELIKIEKELIFYGALSIFFIISIISISYRKNILIYLSFLFFPFSMILSLTLFIELNILHIFILFIILSISIDYGIYISSYKKDKNTNKAIFYSILTTFAGFGVLIFSNINALFSIGISATVGVLSILFLLIFLKKEKSASNNL